MDFRERYPDVYGMMIALLEAHQATLYTGMPGIIVSYDQAKMTAIVQPAIQSLQKFPDGTSKFVTLPKIPDVPVHFPGGGGFLMTFPVKVGDECWIKFSSRCIDNWYQSGGVQTPFEMRMHDIADAVCEVGVRSQPKVPGDVSTDAVQLRSDDGSAHVELRDDGSVRILAPGEVRIEGNLRVTGVVEAGFETGDSVRLQTHTHTQGADTHGDGEEPTNAPTPGT